MSAVYIRFDSADERMDGIRQLFDIEENSVVDLTLLTSLGYRNYEIKPYPETRSKGEPPNPFHRLINQIYEFGIRGIKYQKTRYGETGYWVVLKASSEEYERGLRKCLKDLGFDVRE